MAKTKKTKSLKNLRNAMGFVEDFTQKFPGEEPITKIPLPDIQACLQTLAEAREGYCFKKFVDNYNDIFANSYGINVLGFLEWQCMIADHPGVSMAEAAHQPPGPTTEYFRSLYNHCF